MLELFHSASSSVVFEVTSKSTWAEDTIGKSSLYASLGVAEYFLFDPLHEYMDEAFIGFELQDGEYVPIEAREDGSRYSQELEVILRSDGNMLRVIDPATNEIVPDYVEALQVAQQETERAEQEAQRAENAEAEAARLRAELERLKGGNS